MATALDPSILTVLRASEMFAGCPAADLDHLIASSTEERYDAGVMLIDDQDPVVGIWIVLEGKVALTKRLEGTEVPYDTLGPGETVGEVPLISRMPAGMVVRAATPVRALKIPAELFLETIRSCASVAQTVLRTVGDRLRKYQRMLQQRERMAGLGTISAGLAHELNNPATAAGRAAESAIEVMNSIQGLAREMSETTWSPAGHKLLHALSELRFDKTPEMDPVTRSDREEALCTWLDQHGVADSWELTAPLVSVGACVEELEKVIGTEPISAEELTAVVRWVERFTTAAQLMGEVRQSMTRITELVRAVKAYSHSDHLTPRTEDVHAAIENTITIFAHRLRGAKVELVRQYDRSLPLVATYGGELHQVWTNLIDNAIDAGGTVLKIVTSRDGTCARVDVIDNGSGIPPEVVPRIFDPFFTTKDIGKGTGLGLDIVQRIVAHHKGSVSVESRPGETTFSIRLPLANADGSPPAAFGCSST